MRIIVTRPEPSGTRTARHLSDLGHVAVPLPLFLAEHIVGAVSADLAGASGAAVLTSAEALRALSDVANPVKMALQTLPAFAVGEKTATAARAFGFPTVHVSGGNGEKLAMEIAKRQTLFQRKPLLYLAGEPRSPGLEDGLARRGIPFHTVVCYRMLPIDHDRNALERCIAPDQETAVLLYSAEAARRLTLLGDLIWPGFLDRIAHFICLSSAIAAILPPETLEKQQIAADPTERALLALISPDA